MTWCDPTDSAEIAADVAVPAAGSDTVSYGWPSRVKSTVPVGVPGGMCAGPGGPGCLLTVALKVIDWPNAAGFADAPTARPVYGRQTVSVPAELGIAPQTLL